MYKRFRLKNLFLVLAISLIFSPVLIRETRAQTVQTRNPDKKTKEKLPEEKDGEDKKIEAREVDQTEPDEKTKALEKKTFDLINSERKKEKHAELVWSEKLASVARKQSRAMAKYGFVSIKPYDGRDLRAHLVGVGIKKWLSIGRLVAAGANTPKTVESIVERWLSSKARRQYVFENRWSETGIGIFVTEDGKFFLTLELLSK